MLASLGLSLFTFFILFYFFCTVLTTLPKIYKRFFVVVKALAWLHFSLLHKSVGGAQKKKKLSSQSAEEHGWPWRERKEQASWGKIITD